MPERSMLVGVPAPTAHTCSRVSVARQRVRAGRGVVGCGAPAASIQRRGLAIVPKMSASPLRGRGASMSSHHIQRPHLLADALSAAGAMAPGGAPSADSAPPPPSASSSKLFCICFSAAAP